MILFRKDWANYPTAIRHYTTKNRSFVRLAILFKNYSKIKNYDFLLALINPALEDVDPHDKNLDQETKLAIIEECAENPWYFFREVLKVPAKSGVGANPLKAGRMLIASIWLALAHIDIALCSHRQSGKTFSIQTLKSYLLSCLCFNTTLLWGTINERKRVDTIKQMKEILDLLPDYIYKPIKHKDADNQSILTNAIRNNTVEYVVGQADPVRANEAGRGFSIPIKMYDEVAETKNAGIMIAAAANSSNAVIREAKQKGQPYFSAYMCTAGDLQRKEGKFYHKLSHDGMFWTEALYDSEDEQDLRETVGTNSASPKAPLVNLTFSWRQNGIPKEEFEEIVARAMRDSGGNLEKVYQEVYSIWAMGGVANALTPAQAKVVSDSECEPQTYEKLPSKIMMRWFRSDNEINLMDQRHQLVWGLDTSQGVSRDACSLTLKDITNLDVLARSDVSEVNLNTYGKIVATLLTRHKNSVLVIENKASGQAIIDAVITHLHALGEDPFKRIYNRIWQEPEKHTAAYNDVRCTPLRRRDEHFYNKYKGLFGFSTNARLRQELYDQTLTDAIKLAGSRVKDAVLVKQLCALETRNGRVDHAAGGHDDACISYLLGAWFAIYGKNFKHYGIDNKLPLSATVRTETGACSEEDLERHQKLQFFEGLAEKLKEMIKEEGDSFYGISLQRKLEDVDREIEKLGGAPNNLAQVLEEIKDDAKKQKRRNRWR